VFLDLRIIAITGQRLPIFHSDGLEFEPATNSLPLGCMFTHTRNGKFLVHGFCENLGLALFVTAAAGSALAADRSFIASEVWWAAEPKILSISTGLSVLSTRFFLNLLTFDGFCDPGCCQLYFRGTTIRDS
jgi:hypothetical protein